MMYECSKDCELCHGSAWVSRYPPTRDGSLPMGYLATCPNATRRPFTVVEQMQWGLAYIRRRYSSPWATVKGDWGGQESAGGQAPRAGDGAASGGPEQA